MAGRQVGYATMPVIPSVQGIGSQLQAQVGRPADTIGGAAGKSMGGKMSAGFKKGLAGVGGIIAGTFAIGAIKDFFTTAVNGASDLAEAGTAVGEIFGDAFGTIQQWSRSASGQLGQSTLEALNAAKTFGVYGQAAGLADKANAEFSIGLTTLATDLASFHNTSPEDAVYAIGAALRGESEPIRSFGVLLNEATLRDEALRLGLIQTTKQALTPQQKVLAVQSSLYKQTAVAQGDFAKTSEGLANQNRIAAATWTDVSGRIGSLFLPAVTGVVGSLNTTLLPALDKGTTYLVDNFGAGVTAVTDLFTTGGLGSAIDRIGSVITTTLWPAVVNIGTALYDATTKLGISAWQLLGNALDITAGALELIAPPLLALSGYLADNEGLVLGIVAAYATWKGISVAVGVVTAAQVAYTTATYGAEAASYASGKATGIAALASKGAVVWHALTTSTLWTQVAAYNATNRAIIGNSALTTGTKAVLLGSALWTGIATAAQWAWNTAMTANPIGIIIVAVAALVAGIVWLATQTTFFQDLWTNVTAVVGAAATWLWENAIGPAFTAIGGAATWLWQTVLEPAFTAIGAVINWLWTNVIQPLSIGFLIVFGIIAGIITWAWQSVIMPAIEGIGAVIGWLWLNIVQPYFAAIGAIFTWLWTSVVQPVFSAIGVIFTWVWESILSPIIGFVVAYFKVLGAIATWLWVNAIKPAIDGIGAGFRWVWTTIIQPVAKFIGDAISSIGKTVSNVFGGIGKFIGNAFQAALGAVRGPINGIIGLVNSAIRGINKLKVTIPDWVPVVGGQTWGLNIPQIPNLALGGTVLPRAGGTLVNLAEAGRAETVVDTGLINEQLRRMQAYDDAAPVDSGSATYEGKLYLEGGELLGVVRGEMKKKDDDDGQTIRKRKRT